MFKTIPDFLAWVYTHAGVDFAVPVPISSIPRHLWGEVHSYGSYIMGLFYPSEHAVIQASRLVKRSRPRVMVPFCPDLHPAMELICGLRLLNAVERLVSRLDYGTHSLEMVLDLSSHAEHIVKYLPTIAILDPPLTDIELINPKGIVEMCERYLKLVLELHRLGNLSLELYCSHVSRSVVRCIVKISIGGKVLGKVYSLTSH